VRVASPSRIEVAGAVGISRPPLNVPSPFSRRNVSVMRTANVLRGPPAMSLTLSIHELHSCEAL